MKPSSFSFWTGKAMRKTEACGSTERYWPPTLLPALRLVGVTLGVGLLLASSAARAEDDEDEKTFEEKIIEGIMKGVGGTNMDNTGIDYRERSPLVVPPKLDLPPPATTAAEVKAPNWPKDPDEARRKAAIAARKKENKDPREASRILTPSELNVAKTAPGTSGGTRESDSTAPGGRAKPVLSPSELGFEGRFSSLFGGSKTESKEFTGEPPREALTQPPPGYQTPSPSFAYGTGLQQPLLNKEYNPAAGKYGD
jgi:hypothetical protein